MIVARVLLKTLKVLAWLVSVFVLMQVVPYGRTHSNPPVSKEPSWDSRRTRELAARACFDCHSNETRWPWYADVAPFSWVVQRDVEVARNVINFSEWDRTFDLAMYSGESVFTGNMPTVKYRMAHPDADLNEQETAELVRGLDATLRAPQRP